MSYKTRTGVGVFCISILAMLNSAPAEEKVQMAIAGSSLVSSLPRIADEMGFFRNHGILAEFVSMSSSADTAAALISGSVPVAFTGPGQLVASQARGQDIVAFSATYRGLAGSLILSTAAVAKSGVKPGDPLDQRLRALDGLTIASPSATSTYTLSFLEAATALGATPSFTYMENVVMPAALKSGRIDGFVGSAPYSVAPLMDGSGVEWISGPRSELPEDVSPVFTVVALSRREYADSHSDVILSIAAALADFQSAVKDRPEDVKATILKLFPDFGTDVIDKIFESESIAWMAGKIKPEEIAREVRKARKASAMIPDTVDKIDPRRMIFP